MSHRVGRRWSAGAELTVGRVVACRRLVLRWLLLAVVAGVAGCGGSPQVEPVPTTSSSDLPRIHRSELPVEARATLRRIARRGPFVYENDGATFENRERLLPLRRRGYYREYTVPTPGEDDRGPRRIVAGRKRERYYTADHYASFSRVVP